MTHKLQVSAFTVFSCILVASVISDIVRQQGLGASDLVLVLVIVFCAFGERITEIAGFGVSIKQQTTEKQLQNITETSHRIDQFITQTQTNTNALDIIESTDGLSRDVWSKLVLIRMTLRKLLRAIAESKTILYSPTTSISRMVSDLTTHGYIDKNLADEEEKIRNATFIAEWGIGEQASAADAEFTLKNYGRVFEKLKRQLQSSSTAQATRRP